MLRALLPLAAMHRRAALSESTGRPVMMVAMMVIMTTDATWTMQLTQLQSPQLQLRSLMRRRDLSSESEGEIAAAIRLRLPPHRLLDLARLQVLQAVLERVLPLLAS